MKSTKREATNQSKKRFTIASSFKAARKKGSPKNKETFQKIKSNMSILEKMKTRNKAKVKNLNLFKLILKVYNSDLCDQNTGASSKMEAKGYSTLRGDAFCRKKSELGSRTPSQIARNSNRRKKSFNLSSKVGSPDMNRMSGNRSNNRLYGASRASKIKNRSMGSSDDLVKHQGSPPIKKSNTRHRADRRNKSSMIESKNDSKSHIKPQKPTRISFKASNQINRIEKVKGYNFKNSQNSRKNPKGSPGIKQTRASNTHRGYLRTNPGSPSYHQHPGSPSNMTESYLLDVNKYKKGLTEVQGERITSYCINHQDQLSEYYIVKDEKLMQATNQRINFLRGVCSRCAVRLAGLGFDCREIECSDEIKDKEKILNEFLSRADSIKDEAVTSDKLLNQYSMYLKNHYDQEFEELKRFEDQIDSLVEILVNNKMALRAYMNKNMNEALETIETMKTTIYENYQKIQNFEESVRENFDEIIYKIDMTEIQQILGESHVMIEEMHHTAEQIEGATILADSFNRVDEELVSQFKTGVSQWFEVFQKEVDLMDLKNSILVKNHRFSGNGGSSSNTSRGAQGGHLKSTGASVNGNDNSLMFMGGKDSFKGKHFLSTQNETLNQLSKQSKPSGYQGEHHPTVSIGDELKTDSLFSQNRSIGIDFKESFNESIIKLAHKRSDSNTDYMNILEKISESQNNKNQTYIELLGNNTDSIQGMNGNGLFVIRPCDEDFTEKQTPTIGEQKQAPDFLLQKFEMMRNQVNAKQNAEAAEEANRASCSAAEETDFDMDHDIPSAGDFLKKKNRSENRESGAEVAGGGTMEELFEYMGNEGTTGEGVVSQRGERQAVKMSNCQKILFDPSDSKVD